jgi:dTDP-4-amino-4,6-dideoxygalactose transaminase
MDPTDLRGKITPATRAVVIQHSFGLPADVHGLCDVAADAGIPVIEDCAHTVASSVDGRLVGSFGAAAFFSYESSKPLFAGIGGSAIAQSAELAEKLRAGYADYHQPTFATQLQIESMFLAHRLAYRPSTYWSVRKIYRAFVAAGLIRGNYNRLENDEADGPADDFRRSMGSRQRKSLGRAVARIADETLHRRWVAGEYRSGIARSGIAHFPVFSGADPAFGRYPMLVEDKRQWVERARDQRVELADFYDTPVHPLRGDQLRRVGYEPASCPNAEWVSSRVVSLPTGPQVTSGQVQRAIEYFSR